MSRCSSQVPGLICSSVMHCTIGSELASRFRLSTSMEARLLASTLMVGVHPELYKLHIVGTLECGDSAHLHQELVSAHQDCTFLQGMSMTGSMQPPIIRTVLSIGYRYRSSSSLAYG